MRGLLVLLLAGLALAGPMMGNKLPPNREGGHVRYPKPSKPSYSKGHGTYYYTTAAPSYKSEAPEYYTTRKQYPTTPQPYPMKNSYSASLAYHQPTTPAPAYYPPAVETQSPPSYTKQPNYYSTTTAAPMYYQEETYQTQAPAYYSPSTETLTYYQASYPQETELPTYSRPVEPYKSNQVSNKMPSTYSVPTEVTYYPPTASYTTTPPPMAYYEQASYISEAPVYQMQEEDLQYSVPEGYPAGQDDYYPPQHIVDYAPETHQQPYTSNGQTYYTDSQKYSNEESEYYSVPGYYTTPSPRALPAYYSTHAKEYYPTTTPSYGQNQ